MYFLFEIGLEEVPARMLERAEEELVRRAVALLQRERLVGADCVAEGFSTPRRLAVRVSGVKERQDDLAEELLGPSAQIAYKDGLPGPAALAFAKKAGVTAEALKIVSTPKGDYIAATSLKPGKSASEIIASELPKELASIYWAKTMSWRLGKPEKFVRPVRWMVALLHDTIVPVTFGGHEAGRLTYGHRVLFGAEPIKLSGAVDYDATLRERGFVEPLVANRRHSIRKALDRVCRGMPSMRWREDHTLVDKMTHMTEWPSVIAGSFEAAYLTLPSEVLVTVMRDHQNYFAVEDAAGKLAPHFLAVLNTVANEAGEAVIRHGNERVLRARFNDARFFWEFDQRIPLQERLPLLEKVTFQKDLGSYALKTQRMQAICARLAEMVAARGTKVDAAALHQAAELAKTDLTTELVKEFTELQGQIGGLYARAQGIGETAAAAIYHHYQPASMDDAIPPTVEGQLLSIADKVDSIAGMFSLGLEPTGSKDPFALRRAANGIVKILAEGAVPLKLAEVARVAGVGDATRIASFLAERLEFYLRDVRGQAYDVVQSVLAAGADDVADALARAQAVTAMRGSQDFSAVTAAFKRMSNILAQAAEKGILVGPRIVAASLVDPAEQQLAKASEQLALRVKALSAATNYVGALEAIATLRPQVDAFFESVMVMDPDEAIRANRLTLLRQVLHDFSGIADFSSIVTAGVS